MYQLSVDPTNSAILYAMLADSQAITIYKTMDGAKTWTAAREGLPNLHPLSTTLGLQIDRNNPATLYALVIDATNPSQLYRSTDRATTWTQIATLPASYYSAFLYESSTSTFYFGASSVFKSLDAGKTLLPVLQRGGVITTIKNDPTRSGTLYVGNGGALLKTTDGGQTWTTLNPQAQHLSVTAIEINPSNSQVVYVGTQNYQEGFLFKLNAAGNGLIYANYLGAGSGNGLAVDGNGNAYVTGATSVAGDLRVPALNGFQPAKGLGFLVKVNANGTAYSYATYLPNVGRDVAVNAMTGAAYVVSEGGPVKNAYQPEPMSSKLHLLAVDPQKTGADSILYGSYFAGNGTAFPNYYVAADNSGKVYIAGDTSGPGFPRTAGFSSSEDGTNFVVKFDPSQAGNASVLWSGKINVGGLKGLAVSAAGDVHLTGSNSPTGLPTTPGALQPAAAGGFCGSFPRCIPSTPPCTCPSAIPKPGCPFESVPIACSDSLLTKIKADGSAVIYSTYLGTNVSNDFTKGIALDASDNIYLVGEGGLAATAGAFQQEKGGFITKLTLDRRSTTVTAVSAASFAGTELAPVSLAAGFLEAFGTGADKLEVSVRDSAGNQRTARVLYAGNGQVNFEIPRDTALGTALIQVRSSGLVIASGSIRITSIAPGIFAFSGTGRGVAAAFIVRVKADGTQIYESLARYDETLRQWVAVPVDLGPATDQVFLVLFGTGFRAVPNVSRVQLSVGGQATSVSYAGEQPSLIGVDQINALLPRTLIGRGEVDVATTIDGKTANVVRVAIK